MGDYVYSFENLEVYKRSREFRKKIYRLVSKLPAEEKFNLATQMRRAALSLTNNIAEGHGRFHYQETIQFFRHSRGSLEELLDDLNTCIDEHYDDEAHLLLLKEEGEQILHLLNGYIAYLRRSKNKDARHPNNQ